MTLPTTKPAIISTAKQPAGCEEGIDAAIDIINEATAEYMSNR